MSTRLCILGRVDPLEVQAALDVSTEDAHGQRVRRMRLLAPEGPYRNVPAVNT